MLLLLLHPLHLDYVRSAVLSVICKSLSHSEVLCRKHSISIKFIGAGSGSGDMMRDDRLEIRVWSPCILLDKLSKIGSLKHLYTNQRT
ncbi:hypothetical protein MKW98_003843 [Papaver atlanticum]|uniref:Uncharacterized protein n=1 Tax=Papaver atlanticum TaxID=357466 RepID=A0AAD4XUB0_9MAGN|nr:hypothetical protein MKW98_003843 [Papaver atlanticum]